MTDTVDVVIDHMDNKLEELGISLAPDEIDELRDALQILLESREGL